MRLVALTLFYTALVAAFISAMGVLFLYSLGDPL